MLTLGLVLLVTIGGLIFAIRRQDDTSEDDSRIKNKKIYPIPVDHEASKDTKCSNDFVRSLRNLQLKFLEHGICVISKAFRPLNIVFDPTLVEEMSNSPHLQLKNNIYQMLFSGFTEGIFTHPGGNEHKVLRKPLSKALSKKLLDQDYFPVMMDKCNSLVKYIRAHRLGTTYPIEDDIGPLVLDIFARTHLGVEINETWEREWNTTGIIDQTVVKILNNAAKFEYYATRTITLLIKQPIMLLLRIVRNLTPFKTTSEGSENLKQIDEGNYFQTSRLQDIHQSIDAFFEDKILQLINFGSFLYRLIIKDIRVEKGYALIDKIYTIRKTSTLMPFEKGVEFYTDFLMQRAKELNSPKVLRHLTEFIGAGAETIPPITSGAILFIAMHQEVQEELYTEQVAILGQPPREPTVEDFVRMECLERVCKETLRILCPPFIAKYSTANEIIGNHLIRKGSYVIVCIDCLHHDPRYWQRPDDFFPDHFLPDKEAARHKYSYIPFGIGVRKCPGFQYAQLAMKGAISSLVRNFKITTDLKMEDVELEIGIMRIVKGGCRVKLDPR